MERVEELPGAVARCSPARCARSCRRRAPEQGEAFDAIARRRRPRRPARASRTGSRPASSPTSRPTPRARRSSASCSRPASACRGCCGSTSPACTELETHVLDWLVELLGAARRTSAPTAPGGGVIQDTRVERHAVRDRSRRERASGPAPIGGCDGRLVAYCLDADALVGGEGPARSPASARQPARRSRSTATSPCAPTRSPRQIAADRAAGLRAVLRLRHRGHHLVAGDRPGARDRRDLPRRGPVAARRRGDGRHRGALPRAAAGSTTASSWRRATASTRTSGCSPTSTARLLGRRPPAP